MTSPEGVSPDVWHVHGERVIYDNEWVTVGLEVVAEVGVCRSYVDGSGRVMLGVDGKGIDGR
ncbi:hypothetical protein ACFU8R_28540, partial [Pseudonocardia alni]